MKLVSLLFIIALSVACGKQGGGGGSSSARQEQQGRCDLNGRSVACESIRGADGLGIDLLEAMIDVPVKIQGAEITFLQDKSAMSTGRRINCRLAVKNGEMYRFALRGEKLLIMSPEGSYEMERLSGGPGVNGTWTWNGYIDQGTHLIRNMTILNSNRVIMRSSCEL